MLSWTRSLFRRRGVIELPPPPPPEEAPRAVEPPAVGALLCDRYRLESIVGRGGSSVVYRASDVLLGAEVAVKVLLGDRERPATGEHEARAEAEAVARLSHPHITRVFGYAQHDPWQLIVLEYLAGEDLHASAKRRPGRRFQLPDLLRVSMRCLDALSHAHEAGVVHNDIKPSNIMLTRAGALKVCDFGLSHLAGDSTGPWLLAASTGSQAFMSPERIMGEACDARSDLYSLAATLYTLGSGHTLFGSELAQAWRGHLELPPPPSRYLPKPIFRTLELALSKDPGDRFRSAAEMKEVLLDAFRALREASAARSGRRTSGPSSSTSRSKSAPTRRASEGTPTKSARPIPSAARTAAKKPKGASSKDEKRAATPRHERAGQDASQGGAEPRPVARPQGRLVPPPGMVWIDPCRLLSRFGGDHGVRGFWLMRAPVTNGEYARFVEETGAVPPAHWLGGRPPVRKERHPVVGVSLEQARAYARWAGLRLPSDIEWETAARGNERRPFPWGDAFDARRCNCPERGENDTTPVDEHREGATPSGCLDLVGNVWEWTDPDVSAHACEPGYAWVFGGSFRHPCNQDDGIPRTQVAAGKEYLYLGFRCALDDRRSP